MPASRSRTDRWRECLSQLLERGGALEITLPTGGTAKPNASVLWRVRVLAMDEETLTVEQPNAAGQVMELGDGIDLIAVMQIGQNRWMFHTRTLPPTAPAPSGAGRARGLRLMMPGIVERCQRRNFYRISTAELSLPTVECWPLIDPTSVPLAEVANRAQILEMLSSGMTGMTPASLGAEPVLPEVGPKFRASLVNVGGGGAGLMVERGDAGALERCRLFWLRLNLTPHIPAPIAVTARLAHTHVDSTQNIYCGLAFDFAFNPSHRQFVVDQVCRYVGSLQRQQMLEGGRLRRVA
ncbi:MAG: hypothetical protein IT437_00600 [Phycisphaerales bacterium]|nr:hypothetical protein [Phycisphaerales bacterium]